jgi:hypothetical protein
MIAVTKIVVGPQPRHFAAELNDRLVAFLAGRQLDASDRVAIVTAEMDERFLAAIGVARGQCEAFVSAGAPAQQDASQKNR